MSLARFPASSPGQPSWSGAAVVGEIIGSSLGAVDPAPAPYPNSTWITLLCLSVSVTVLLIAAGQGAYRHSEAIAPIPSWTGIILLVFSIGSRAAWPDVRRVDRTFFRAGNAGGEPARSAKRRRRRDGPLPPPGRRSRAYRQSRGGGIRPDEAG